MTDTERREVLKYDRQRLTVRLSEMIMANDDRTI